MGSFYHRSKDASKSSAPLAPQQGLDLLGIPFHDLRSSLVSLSAVIHMLNKSCHEGADYPVKARLAELIDKIGNLSSTLEESLQMVLALDEDNRLESHLIDLKCDIVETVISEFISDIKTKRLSIQTKLDPVIGGIIDISIKPENLFFLLKIANTGRPITEELQTKLFLKPLPPKDRKETNPDGMGFGLHLVKRIIQTHGGDIWHEPDTGGTAFILAIPKEASDTHFTNYTQGTLFS